MKYYAVFYRNDVRSGSFTDVLGDRGLVRLDGRLSMANMHVVSRAECSTRGFDGYRIVRGNSLLNLFVLTANVVPVGGRHD